MAKKGRTAPSGTLWDDGLRKAMTTAGEKVVDASLRALLLGTPLAAAAAVAAPAIAAGVKVLLEHMDTQGSEIEEQLDRIIAEPLSTARQILQDCLRVQASTIAELAERERQLANAFDNLRRAFTFAEEAADENDCRYIRFHMAFVAALKEGGRPFVTLYLNDLRAEVARKRDRVDTAKKMALRYEQPPRKSVV